MSFVPARLRAGEILAGAAGIVLAISLFAITWYRAPGASLTGWQCFGVLRWLLLASVVLALAMVLTQAALRAPAIPVNVDVVACTVSLITFVWLAVRVLVAGPDGFSTEAGAWLALAAQLFLLAATVLAMRQEGIREEDGPGEIPVVDLDPPFGEGPPPADPS